MKTLVSSLVLVALVLAVEAIPPRSNPPTQDGFVLAQTYCPNGRC
jgi:hypothetical protein